MPTGLIVPPSYFWPSVACLFLCLPTAVVALYFSARATRSSGVGDWRVAVRSSRLARSWCLLSVLAFAIGVALILAGH